MYQQLNILNPLNYLYFLPQPEDHQPLVLNLQWNFENFLDCPLQNLR